MYVAYICDIYVDLVRVTPLSLYPLSGIWQELGPNYGGISSQRVARNGAFDNLVQRIINSIWYFSNTKAWFIKHQKGYP